MTSSRRALAITVALRRSSMNWLTRRRAESRTQSAFVKIAKAIGFKTAVAWHGRGASDRPI